MLPWVWNLWYEKNGAGASAVYDPVRHFDPHGPGTDSLIRPVSPLFEKNISSVRTWNLCDPGGHFCADFPWVPGRLPDLRNRQELSSEEGQYLLAFCNNLGPVYFPGICTASTAPGSWCSPMYLVCMAFHCYMVFPCVIAYTEIGFQRKQTKLSEETTQRSF